jgi:hypothetical protein
MLVAGMIHPIKGSCVIGRWHTGCPSNECISKGFWDPPEISISDKHSYISRHHLRVQLDSANECWIKDLHSLNGTAIFHAGPDKVPRKPYLERLVPGKWHALIEGDLVALAYPQHKRPYFVISYHQNGRW